MVIVTIVTTVAEVTIITNHLYLWKIGILPVVFLRGVKLGL
jgi:hypothetical protein